ncbi:hypothetical protein SAMN05216298_0425 [Glycomyces sambucus]|uniref:Uncharacterized protein n=2 Tax=Glycomyces sambucus TaxID=380244 RepID=A0A1G9CMQ7_9ACTN|nr:hypothetical protein SAMN05216298_0425 [Glycomyces sambucus]
MVIGPMIVGVLLPLGFLAVKRFTDKLPERSFPHSGPSRKQPPSSVADRELTPMASAAAIVIPDEPIPDKRTFEFNREKILYFMFIVMSLACVGGCVTGLFDRSARSDGGDGRPIGDLEWLAYTNAAVLAAVFLITVSVAGAIAPGYFLRLESDQLVLGRWFRSVVLPWSGVRRLRIEQGWLIATVDAPVEILERVHHINGLERPGAYRERIRTLLEADDVALVGVAALNGHRRNRREFTIWVERFWSHGMATAPPVERAAEPDRDTAEKA